MFRKPLALAALLTLFVGACSTNAATGRSQFTGLMSSADEVRIGAQEQQKAQAQFGVVEDRALQAYVTRICDRLVPGVERHDLTYTCTVLDSPVVNAFALPGGYININRGVLAFASDEDEVAGVLAHEMGHVAAKHISERYTQSALAQIGATALSIGIGSNVANQVFGVGANMYLASYSRGQESESDDLGIRYMSRAGYDPTAMAGFLANLQRSSALQAAEEGSDYKEEYSFMASHPMTGDRVARATMMAGNYPPAGGRKVDALMRAVNGMVYGDSAKDGFVRGQEFVHPEEGFAFTIPAGFRVKNQPDRVLGLTSGRSGAAFVFDMAPKPNGMDPASYIAQSWTKGQTPLEGMQPMDVNGMRGATAQTQGTINNTPALIRLVAIEWSPTQVVRFQFVMPQATSDSEINALKGASYSLRRLSPAERQNDGPKRIAVVTAGAGESVASLTRRMAFDDNLNDKRFRALNGMNDGEPVVPGRQYKIVVQ